MQSRRRVGRASPLPAAVANPARTLAAHCLPKPDPRLPAFERQKHLSGAAQHFLVLPRRREPAAPVYLGLSGEDRLARAINDDLAPQIVVQVRVAEIAELNAQSAEG